MLRILKKIKLFFLFLIASNSFSQTLDEIKNLDTIYIYFKNPQNRKIEKYLPLVFKKYSNKCKYFLNLTFLKDNPNEIYLSFKKVIK